ncbi:MAG: ABC transporter permease [Eubacteriaceae bacterium]|nr:ABC transporter permease [Eubacteriaceae bacterium]
MAFSNNKIKAIVERLDKPATKGYDIIHRESLFSRAKTSPGLAEQPGYTGYAYWKSTLNIFKRNTVAMFCLVLIISITLFTFMQPFLPGHKDPAKIHNNESGMHYRNQPPSLQFLMGTNSIGQDLWSRTWAGARTSLVIGFAVSTIDTVLGVAMGIIWGFSRKIEWLFTELYNIFDNVPQTILLILASYILKPGILTIILALSLTGWLVTARFIRNQVVIIRNRDYNLASRCLGTPVWRMMLSNLAPYLVSVITLRMAMAVPVAISDEVFVSYIGLGLPQNIPSLGNLIISGIDKLLEPSLRHQIAFPALILSTVTVCFYVVGNAFADASDPRNHIY